MNPEKYGSYLNSKYYKYYASVYCAPCEKMMNYALEMISKLSIRDKRTDKEQRKYPNQMYLRV